MSEHVDQDRGPNFRASDGRLYLIRCYACEPRRGRENYVFSVPLGVCAWCGWSERGGERDERQRP